MLHSNMHSGSHNKGCSTQTTPRSLHVLLLTSSRTQHQYLMDHPLHGAQVLLPQVAAVGAPEGDDAPLSIALEVGPFLHDLTHLRK